MADAIQPAIRQHEAPAPSWSHPNHPGATSLSRRATPKPKLAAQPIGSNTELGARRRLVWLG
jgi:hypothetical protein